MKNRRPLIKLGSGLLSALLMTIGIFFTAEVSRADPPSWAPAYGYRHNHKPKVKRVYQYIYYPASQVYYTPSRRVYYYLNNGVWTNGGLLPTRIQLGRGVSIELAGAAPYVYHPVVLQKYPVLVVP